MNDAELRYAIGEGLVKNEIDKFLTRELIAKCGKTRLCPTVYRAAWKLYLESVKDVPSPA